MIIFLTRFEAYLQRLAKRLGRYPEWLLASVIFLVVALIIFARVLLRPNLMVIGSDFTQFYFWEYFSRQELASGQLPQWNPYFLAGYPFLANPQTRIFYPFLWLTRLFPLGYSFGIYLTLHVWLAGLGMYGLSRSQDLSRVPAYISGLSFMMGGVLVTHIAGGHMEWISTIVWLPWVLWTWNRTLIRASLRSPVLACLFTTLMFLGGGPRVLICVMVMLTCIGTLWLISRLRERHWREIAGGFARLALGGVILGGLIAPQLLPTLEFTTYSTRSGGIPISCTGLFSLNLADLASFVMANVPFDIFLAWERNGYAGGLALVLALLSLLWTSAWARLNLLWAVLGFLIGLGPALPVYAVFHDWMPGFSFIRQPFTLIVLPGFALSALAGVGAQRVTESKKGVKVALASAAILSLVAIAFDVALYKSSALTFSGLGPALRLLTSLSAPRYLLAGLALALLLSTRIRRIGLLAALCVLFVDLGLFASSNIPVSPESVLTARPLEMPQVNAAEARIATFPYMHSISTTYTHTANAHGFAAIFLETYNNLALGMGTSPECSDFEHPAIAEDDEQFFRLLSVRYVVDIDSQPVQLENYYPRAVWVKDALPVNSSQEAIRQVRADANYDPQRSIYVEGLPADSESSSATSATSPVVRITNYQTQSVTLEVDSTSAGWVYLNDVWYPGWSATVNDEPQKIYRANGTFRAVQVPAGHNTVVMTFQSTYLNLGLAIGAVTLVAIVVLAVVTAIRTRARPAAPPVRASS